MSGDAPNSNGAASVFTDFCQAWGARFPGSELPDAWEEDVRANLKKHKTKVAILKDELEKEQMYVEYLQTLLKDIEKKKKQRSSQQVCREIATFQRKISYWIKKVHDKNNSLKPNEKKYPKMWMFYVFST